MSLAKTSGDSANVDTTIGLSASGGPEHGTAQSSSRLLFWGAAAVALVLIPIFFLQVFWANLLITPWYVPIGGTIAALVVLYLVRRGHRWLRLGVALLCVALAAMEWFFVLAATVLPAYRGPVVVGSTLPPFRATLADGSEIDAEYFERGRPTALVFFQGRWCPFCMTQLRELEEHHAEFGRANADVVVVSIEDPKTAEETQRDFPHLTVVSDERRELSNAIDLINEGFAPDGSDSAAPTMLVVDGAGTVKWLHRPTRFIARPSAADIVAVIEKERGP